MLHVRWLACVAWSCCCPQAAERRALKLQKRAAFDAKRSGAPLELDASKDPSYFESLKAELAAKVAQTEAALAGLDPAAAASMQGMRAGIYVRIVLAGECVLFVMLRVVFIVGL